MKQNSISIEKSENTTNISNIPIKFFLGLHRGLPSFRGGNIPLFKT
jgi:hypothetical protein